MKEIMSIPHKIARRAKRAFNVLVAPPSTSAPQDVSLESDQVLPAAPLFDLISTPKDVQMRLLGYQDGYVRPVELLSIAAIVSDQKPLCILEVGTFKGNTALQMALNSPAEAQIYTLDLPYNPSETVRPVESKDLKYVHSNERPQRAFVGTPFAGKIHEMFGDSATFDFSKALGGKRVNLAFIDGSHSYEYVKNDTEKVLPLMAPGGVVLWHDYDFRWPGVCRYLNERRNELSLRRIEDTTIGYHRVAK